VVSVIEDLSWAIRSAALPPTALWLLAAWSAAEALWWPIIPDFALAVLAFSNPPAWPLLAAATVAGSMLGGLAAYRLGQLRLVPPMPMTTARMAEAVDRWLGHGAARGVWHQPLSGVPFKVFAYRAAGNRVGPLAFLAVAAPARGVRMAVVGAVAAGLGQLFWAHGPQGRQAGAYLLLVALAVAGFGAGLARIFKRWS
jgi:membrane protein YqaA with SNARE-associated domain